ncbi:hypothetical protein B0T24DRAFT_694239 [Lasiosphaeria ovina]|uniref:Uncharacterized protein n=1 Tax=Lasiosphaeria ovina TaxID=92902 RepID=A0AAE0KM26_9PEZI|nr:hypothetical protein B0T24DRAFT_694239 [Lasiosphaeria ovina]
MALTTQREPARARRSHQGQLPPAPVTRHGPPHVAAASTGAAIPVAGSLYGGSDSRVSSCTAHAASFPEWPLYREPAVDLNVMTSANPLPADYQVHNTNIFSVVDNFEFKRNGQTMYLDAAEADYSVIGWRSRDDDDPMTSAAQPADSDVPPHGDRMAACNMRLLGYDPDSNPNPQPGWTAAAAARLKQEGGRARTDARTLCHAAMYEAKWTRGGCQEQSRRGRRGRTSSSAARSPSGRRTSTHWSRTLTRWAVTDTGVNWLFKQQSAPGEQPKVATPADVVGLDQLNKTQAALENAQREVASLRWKLFAIWSVDVGLVVRTAQPRRQVRDKLSKVLNRLKALIGSGDSILPKLEQQVKSRYDEQHHSNGTASRFYQRQDPAILFAKTGSGWKPDFSQPVQQRRRADGWDRASQQLRAFASKTPDEVRPAVEAVLDEFFALRTAQRLTKAPDPSRQVVPYFRLSERNLWKDTQPWRPLMSVNEHAGTYGASALRYFIKEDVSKLFDSAAPQNLNIVHIAGRNLVQPQAASAFAAIVEQVFRNTNPSNLRDAFGVSSAADQKRLLDVLSGVQFVSVGSVKDGGGTRPNTALPQPDRDARHGSNAVFVHKVLEDGRWKWRRTSDWESPIWGWPVSSVVNYADSGLQLFLADGTFYREARFGTQAGAAAGFRFRFPPFDPERAADGTTKTAAATQLEHLIAKLSDAAYLKAFIHHAALLAVRPARAHFTRYRHDGRLAVLGLLLDPFLPVHASSAGVLPPRALRRMPAFWRVGPPVVAADVDPQFAPSRVLVGADYAAALLELDRAREMKKEAGGVYKVGLPVAPPVLAAAGAAAGAGGDSGGGEARFVYLQPYSVEEDDGRVGGKKVKIKKTQFNPYAIDGLAAAGADAEQAHLVPGPYTTPEGYLQLVKPPGQRG